MPEPELIRAQRYHDRARHLRKVATQVDDPKTSATLKQLAQEYEGLSATILTRRLKRKKPGR